MICVKELILPLYTFIEITFNWYPMQKRAIECKNVLFNVMMCYLKQKLKCKLLNPKHVIQQENMISNTKHTIQQEKRVIQCKNVLSNTKNASSNCKNMLSNTKRVYNASTCYPTQKRVIQQEIVLSNMQQTCQPTRWIGY